MNKKLFDLRIRPLLITIIAGSLVLATGFYLGQNLRTPQTTPSNGDKREAGYKFISPLLECGNSQPAGLAYNTLAQNIQKIIDSASKEKKIKTASVYFRDLNNGPWIGINEKEKFSPASLLKVPVLIAYLKLAETDSGLLSKKIRVKDYNETVLNQNIPPEAQVVIGQEYVVEDLIRYMIEYSDNIAADALLENSPPEDLDKIYTDLKLQIPGTGDTENFMTVLDYASFFRILYNSSYLNRIMSEKALEILTTSDFVKGLTAGLPNNIKVAHKFGERKIGEEKQLHDCGIVYLENNDYLLCIMTRGDDFGLMEQTIADISRTVFSEMNKFTKK